VTIAEPGLEVAEADRREDAGDTRCRPRSKRQRSVCIGAGEVILPSSPS
jgi:hypothetical protein